MYVSIRADYRVHIRVWSPAYTAFYRCKIKGRQRLFKAFPLRFYVTVCLLTSLFSHHIFAEEMSAKGSDVAFLTLSYRSVAIKPLIITMLLYIGGTSADCSGKDMLHGLADATWSCCTNNFLHRLWLIE
jgi:hypothetical protein